MAHQATGLWRLSAPNPDGSDPPPPYWAFPWAGGMALATHLMAQPHLVAGRSVLDLGSGSGLVAIAAALAGAATVAAVEIDAFGQAAIRLNAEANGVRIETLGIDVTRHPAPAADTILVGDLFYEEELARRVLASLDARLAAGSTVLIGDPGRKWLPIERLRRLADYRVDDVGDVEGRDRPPAGVFLLEGAG